MTGSDSYIRIAATLLPLIPSTKFASSVTEQSVEASDVVRTVYTDAVTSLEEAGEAVRAYTTPHIVQDIFTLSRQLLEEKAAAASSLQMLSMASALLDMEASALRAVDMSAWLKSISSSLPQVGPCTSIR
jgi:hypothetical protein